MAKSKKVPDDFNQLYQLYILQVAKRVPLPKDIQQKLVNLAIKKRKG